MLSKEIIEKITKLGLNYTELEAAIKAETETAITIPDGELMTAEQLTARDANAKKNGIAEGKQAGIEIANKSFIEKFQLIDVTKTDEPNKIAEAVQAVLATGDSGLKEQIKALQTDKQTLEGKLTSLETEKKTIERNTSLLQKMPKNRLNVLNDSEYLSILAPMIEEVDGTLAIKVNGTLLRDEKTKDLLAIDKAINTVFEQRGWVEKETPAGGRGGKTETGTSGIKTLSEAKAQFIKENPDKNELSSEFSTYLTTVTKDVADFDFSK